MTLDGTAVWSCSLMGYIDSCFVFRGIQRRFSPLEMHSRNALKFVSVRSS